MSSRKEQAAAEVEAVVEVGAQAVTGEAEAEEVEGEVGEAVEVGITVGEEAVKSQVETSSIIWGGIGTSTW